MARNIEESLVKEVKKPLQPFKYGDKVFHVYPGLSKHAQVANIHEFKAEVREYTVLFQFFDQVVVTSEQLVSERVAEHAGYWKVRDEHGHYRNFSTSSIVQAASTVLWRESLFSTKEEALAYQREALELAMNSLRTYAARLNEL